MAYKIGNQKFDGSETLAEVSKKLQDERDFGELAMKTFRKGVQKAKKEQDIFKELGIKTY
jgi:hypothetical protein